MFLCVKGVLLSVSLHCLGCMCVGIWALRMQARELPDAYPPWQVLKDGPGCGSSVQGCYLPDFSGAYRYLAFPPFFPSGYLDA